MKHLLDPLQVIVMPMRGNNETKGRLHVHAKRFEVVQRGRTLRAEIEAGIDRSPVTITQMEDNTLAVARPKN